MSLVILAEPIGITAECRIEPAWYTAILVVLEPISTSVTPNSISSFSNVDSADAKG